MRPLRISAWMSSSIANAAIGASGVATGILLARGLGPNGRGELVASMLWPNLVITAGAVLNLQSGTYFLRKATTPETRAEVFGVGLVLAGVLSVVLPLVSWPVIAVALASAGPSTRSAAHMYSLVVPLMLLQGFGGAILLADDRVGTLWGIRLVGTILYLVGVIVIVVLGSLTVLRTIVLVLVSQAVTTVIMCFYVHHHIVPRRPRWNKTLCRQILVFGVKTNFVGTPLNVRLDQLLMSMWLPATVLGLYTTAFTWASTIGIIATGPSTVILSRSSGTSRDDPVAVSVLLGQFRRLALVFVALGVLTAVAAPIGIPLLFGPAFAPSVVPAAILCVATVLLNMNLVLHELARGLGEPGIGIRAEFAGFLVTAFALAALLQSTGGVGAAVASILGFGTVLITLVALLRRRLGFSARLLLLPRFGDFGAIVRHLEPLLRLRSEKPGSEN